MPCYMVMAVAKRHPMETMPFHRTGKTLSFRYSAYLYDIAFRKYRHINLVSNVWSLVSSKFFLSTFAFCLLPFYLNGQRQKAKVERKNLELTNDQTLETR